MRKKTVFLFALLFVVLSSCSREVGKEGTGNLDISGDVSSGDGGKPGDSSGDGGKPGDSSGDGGKPGDSSGDGGKPGDSSGDSGNSGVTPLPRTSGPSKLNDTGIASGGSYPSGNNSVCVGVEITQQDCSHGRDALAVAGKLNKAGGGLAGFDFTKLGKDGSALTVQNGTWSDFGNESAGTRWSCVKDNHTGLVWEVKNNDGSAPIGTNPTVSQDNIHHKDNTYRWGGLTALGRDRTDKEGTYYDDWNSLVNGTNGEKLCGFNDWRVPTREEIRSIVHYNTANLAIDIGYFPNTKADNVWSSSTYIEDGGYAWRLDFIYGEGSYFNRTDSSRVRLVRFVP